MGQKNQAKLIAWVDENKDTPQNLIESDTIGLMRIDLTHKEDKLKVNTVFIDQPERRLVIQSLRQLICTGVTTGPAPAFYLEDWMDALTL